MGLERGVGLELEGVEVGVCARWLVLIDTSAIFWSSQVGCGKVCSV